MKFDIEGPLLISPKKFADDRGFFSESYKKTELKKVGICDEFVQDNHSLSLEKGVVRGLHFQIHPHAQGKLVRVTRGSIFDVAVDIRKSSPTYGKHVSVELSAENWNQLWVPVGFAHGFCTLQANTEVMYKVTDEYAPECDAGVMWNDVELAIDWPVSASEAILSDKDCRHPFFSQLPDYF
tara:strand:+ start:1111 stop:1653 length:543 start_codon:yes stop_codon:yes gene_type:complete